MAHGLDPYVLPANFPLDLPLGYAMEAGLNTVHVRQRIRALMARERRLGFNHKDAKEPGS